MLPSAVAVTRRSIREKERERESDKEKKKLQRFSGAVLSRDEMPFHITSLCVAIMSLRKIHTARERGAGGGGRIGGPVIFAKPLCAVRIKRRVATPMGKRERGRGEL